MQAQTKEAMKLLSEKIPKKPDPNQSKSQQLFQLNRIELKKAKSGSPNDVARQLMNSEEYKSLEIDKRMRWISPWVEKAKSLKPELGSKHHVVRHVAALLYSLTQVGVKELVTYNSNGVSSVISKEAFDANPEHTIKSIVEASASYSIGSKVEVWGQGDWIVNDHTAKIRLAFVFSFFDSLAGKLVEKTMRRKWLSNLTVDVSWITMKELKSLIRSFKSDSGSSQFRNVFLLGIRKSGRSTTRWLLTGRGREDIAVNRNQTTRYVNAKDDRHGYPLTVWDTPALPENIHYVRGYKGRIKTEVMRANYIGAFVLQAMNYRHPTKEEIAIIKEINSNWFGNKLKENLMIVFRVDADESIERYKTIWEEKLKEGQVGAIGYENYICFNADMKKITDEMAVNINKRERDRAKALLLDKEPKAIDNSDAVRKAIHESAATRSESFPNMVRDVIMSADGDDNTEILRQELESAYRIRASFSKHEGHLRIAIQRNWPMETSSKMATVVQRGTRALVDKGKCVYIIEPATSRESKQFLIDLSNTKPPRPGNGKDIKKWVSHLFHDSFKILQMENVPGQASRRFQLFDNNLGRDDAIKIISAIACPGTLRRVKDKDRDSSGA